MGMVNESRIKNRKGVWKSTRQVALHLPRRCLPETLRERATVHDADSDLRLPLVSRQARVFRRRSGKEVQAAGSGRSRGVPEAATEEGDSSAGR